MLVVIGSAKQSPKFIGFQIKAYIFFTQSLMLMLLFSIWFPTRSFRNPGKFYLRAFCHLGPKSLFHSANEMKWSLGPFKRILKSSMGRAIITCIYTLLTPATVAGKRSPHIQSKDVVSILNFSYSSKYRVYLTVV